MNVELRVFCAKNFFFLCFSSCHEFHLISPFPSHSVASLHVSLHMRWCVKWGMGTFTSASVNRVHPYACLSWLTRCQISRVSRSWISHYRVQINSGKEHPPWVGDPYGDTEFCIVSSPFTGLVLTFRITTDYCFGPWPRVLGNLSVSNLSVSYMQSWFVV